MNQRYAIKSLFILVAFFLMLFPLILTFNDVLTKIVQKFVLYTLLQDVMVPLEIKIIGFIVRPFGIAYIPLRDGMIVNTLELHMAWNCLGWQSLVLFIGSLFVGLWNSSFTFLSKGQTIFMGLFGIFWVNILRISFTVILAAYAPPVFHLVYHDYLAAFVTIFYLLIFWWFTYKFVLEEKGTPAD